MLYTMNKEGKKMDEEIREVTVTDMPEDNSAETGNSERVGNIKISVEVVATIAGVATTACDGVYAMAGSLAGDIAERFGARKKSPNKGVKVDMNETSAALDLYIIVKYGVRIPELAWEVQEAVKNSVESMTGLTVDKVNIHIEGVSFEEDEPEAEAQPEEEQE